MYNFINVNKCMYRRGGIVVERAPRCSIIGRDRPTCKSLKQIETAHCQTVDNRCELHRSSEDEPIGDYQFKGLARVTVSVARLRTLTAEKQSVPSNGQNL